MNCPECGFSMDYVVLKKRGPVWICGRCGRMESDGTANVDYPIVSSSSEIKP